MRLKSVGQFQRQELGIGAMTCYVDSTHVYIYIRLYKCVCVFVYVCKHLHTYMNMYSWRRTQGPWGQENAEAQEAASTTMVKPGPVESSEHQIISDCWYTSNILILVIGYILNCYNCYKLIYP